MNRDFRFWEIDLIRGLAVFGMIFYHLLVDLRLFYFAAVPVFEGYLLIFARLVAIVFIFLAGVSASFQFAKTETAKPLLKRAFIILFWAGIISIVTYILFPKEFIFFGILHLIGTSLLLLIPFLYIKSNILIFLSGCFVIITGIVSSTPPRGSLDYFPLLPWFGLVLIGLVFGRLYPYWRNKLSLQEPKTILTRTLKLTGRNSLVLYLLHQPILMGLLFAVERLSSLMP